MAEKFDEKQLAFIELCATGAKQYEAYIEVYGGEGLALQSIKNRARKVATDEVKAEIVRRRSEYEMLAADEDTVNCESFETDAGSEVGEITRERLLAECDYVMRVSKPCISKKLNNIPIINKDAANVYLKAIETSAKIIGAFVPEEKSDNVIEIIMPPEMKELAK